MIYIFIFVILFMLELTYFRVADRYNIIDKPNQRSLHSEITIRGGGIIFSVAAFLYFFFYGMQYPYFFVGLLLISLISFLDDIYSLSNRYRIIVHFFSIFLLLHEVGLYPQMGLWIVAMMVVLVGILNAYNFMDGVNGMTGGYSLVNLFSLFILNNCCIKFIDNELIVFLSLGVLVFVFFNFRKKAKCFAGDVGSISIAFIIIFLLILLIMKTNQGSFILFLSLYGIDTTFTIVIRLLLKESIFKAHNKHLFQLLVSKSKLSHLQVSLIYGLLQLLINLYVIFLYISEQTTIYHILIVLVFLSCVYVYMRRNIVKEYITIK